MAQCKYCGRSGWFLSVSKSSLCKECDSIVVMDVGQRARIINDSMKIVEEAKKIDTQISRCELIIEHAEAMIKYETKGVPTIQPSPTILTSTYQSKIDEVILDGLRSELENAQTKAEVTARPKSKINIFSKVLLKIREYKPQAKNPELLNELEGQVAGIIHQIQLNDYLEQAKKAEFKKQPKKALEQYYEALYFLKNDEIKDSFQSKHISLIEAKISGLSAGEGK